MIHVLIIDDSGIARTHLAHILGSAPGIQVIGSAASGKEALAFIARQKPDLITMDIHMPEMDGYEATRRIMESTPVPIIIISAAWDPRDQASSFKALQAGALVCLPKPPGPGHPGYAKAVAEIITTVRQMAAVKVNRHWLKRSPAPAVPLPVMPYVKQPVQIAALGASTGGPAAIQQLLAALPIDCPVPLLIVQHIARGFARGFVDWLNSTSPLPVYLATNHEPIWKGRIYVAPDDLQMGVTDDGKIALSNAPPEHFLRPSASYLLRSVAETYGQAAVGMLMSGMGKDGAAELKLIRDAGGITFAQDKESSVVHGMPGEAIRLGAACHILPPAAMAAALIQITRVAAAG
jgi:two-component system chemotaxis response regulator CheB